MLMERQLQCGDRYNLVVYNGIKVTIYDKDYMNKYQWYSEACKPQSMVPLMKMKNAKEPGKGGGRERSEFTFIHIELKSCWLLSVENSESFCNEITLGSNIYN